jgi:hypothetical protein
MKALFFSLFFVLSLLQGFAQRDSTAQNKQTKTKQGQHKSGLEAKNFGLSAAGLYGLLRMKAPSYVIPGTNGQIGNVQAYNSGGGSIGLFLMLGKRPLRLGLDATLCDTKVKYDLGTAERQTGDVYNATIEIPVHYIYFLSPASASRRYSVVAGPRLMLPIAMFQPLLPTERAVNLNVDLAFGFQQFYLKSTMNVEFFYSFGVFNIVTPKDNDFTDHAVKSLFRDYLGVRIYFH